MQWDLTMLDEVNIIDSYVDSTRFHFFEYRSSRTCYVFYVGIDFLINLYFFLLLVFVRVWFFFIFFVLFFIFQ